MAKADGAQQETNLAQAGLPPSYGTGIQQWGYGGRNNPNFLGYSGMASSGPSNNFLQQLLQMTQGGNQFGMNRGVGRFNPAQAGFNFGTPISSPSLFQGLSGMNGNQTTPLGQSMGWSQRG